MRLSGTAHQLIGEEAARLVRSNITVNHEARERAIQLGSIKAGQTKHTDFDLKFPPGY